MIILALYYSFCDLALIGQIHYYRFLRKTYPDRFISVAPNEESPLIPRYEIKKWYQRDGFKSFLEWFASIAFVVIVGVGAWQFNRGNGNEVPTGPEEEKWDLKAQIFGWMSAFLYCEF
jgi:solute carrier family 66 (lysosomal lysine-arginine transporter), member 1